MLYVIVFHGNIHVFSQVFDPIVVFSLRRLWGNEYAHTGGSDRRLMASWRLRNWDLGWDLPSGK